MIRVNRSASCGATVCHITCVEEKPCSSNSGGPLPPTRAKMRPDEVLIHSDLYPGNRSARSDMGAPSASNFVCRCRWQTAGLCHLPSPTNRNRRIPDMSIDFEIPAEAKAIREKVRKWVHEECIPAEKELETKPLADVLGPLRKKARAQGLWVPWAPKEYGGMGLGPLANALVQMELGESMLGALSMNTQGPDDASM